MTTTIPVRRTSLVGRDADIEAIVSRLATSPVVTLVGVGGVGKSSLSQEVARVRQADGTEVHLVDLTTVTEDSAVARAAADQIGLQVAPEMGPEDALAYRFEGTAGHLLVLDNCEQVLDGVASLVDRLLARCPDLAVLTTSRERLDVDGEVVWPVQPLDADAPDAPAVQLLLERIDAAAPGSLDHRDRQALIGLAQQLDGVPLALELAAARLSTMSLDELRGQLRDHLPDLRGGRRSADRHRSLGSVVEWSYELLDPPARDALDQLSVFAGGFTRSAARSVVGEGVDDAIDRLVEASLLLVVEGPAPRYRMLEMIRAFAHRRLEQRDDRAAIAQRHADWVARFLAEDLQLSRGPDERETVERYAVEHANIGIALRCACQSAQPELVAHILEGLQGQLLHRAGHELNAWIEEALQAVAGSPAEGTVTVLAALANMRRGDIERTETLLDVAEAAGWTGAHLAMPATAIRGSIAMFSGELERSTRLMAEWIEMKRDGADTWELALATMEHTLPQAYAGHFTEALASAERATELADPLQNPTLSSWCAYGKAEALMNLDPQEAIRFYAEAQRHAEAVDNPMLLGLVAVSRASALARYGAPAEAFAQFEAAIELFARTSAWSFLSTALRNFTELLVRVELYAEAAVLRAAISELEGSTGVAGVDAARDRYLRAMLEDRLLTRRYEELVEEGCRLDREEVIDRAQAIIGRELPRHGVGVEFAAVVFTDLVDATAFMADHGDQEARAIMRRYEVLTQDLLDRHRGKRVKGTGDGVLATFPTVSEALRCVDTLLDALDDGAASGALPLQVRVGVHAGEMIDETTSAEGDDVHGTVVNLTARVVDRAGGGEIVVTDTVRQIVVGAPFRFEPLGEFDLKGIPDPIRLHRLARGTASGRDTEG